MTAIFTSEELAFRDEVAALVEAAPDRDPLQYFRGRGGPTRELYRQLGARGWLSLSWPEELGGRGLRVTYDYLLWDTLAYHRAARPDLGPGIVAHIIGKYGSDAQRARFMPGLRSGETCFALGYSEPEAGSDLTGLKTRADRDGDSYLVRGEKCWTSDAHHADHIWLLCRTGRTEERSRGLTLLVVDTGSPGITITPIETIDGHRLNQVFFDEVVVPVEDRVGEEGQAWALIREALAIERHLQLLPGRVRRDLEDLQALLAAHRPDDAAARRHLAELSARLAQLEASALGTVAELVAGRPGVVEAACTKLLGTALAQEIPRVALDLVGPEALVASSPLAFLWKQSFMETVAGGSTEIMKSVIAREALGLGSKS